MLKLFALVVLGQLPLISGLTLREQASFLLTEPKVQKELKVTPQQASAIEATLKSHDDRSNALVDNKTPASDPAYVASDRQFAAEAVAGLSDVQKRALFVRAVRERGVAALADAEVAKEVGLAGTELTRVQAAANNMDARDEKVTNEYVAALTKIPAPQPPTQAYLKRTAALDKEYAAKDKVRAAARKKEEAALLASLPLNIRAAWKKLNG